MGDTRAKPRIPKPDQAHVVLSRPHTQRTGDPGSASPRFATDFSTVRAHTPEPAAEPQAGAFSIHDARVRLAELLAEMRSPTYWYRPEEERLQVEAEVRHLRKNLKVVGKPDPAGFEAFELARQAGLVPTAEELPAPQHRPGGWPRTSALSVAQAGISLRQHIAVAHLPSEVEVQRFIDEYIDATANRPELSLFHDAAVADRDTLIAESYAREEARLRQELDLELGTRKVEEVKSGARVRVPLPSTPGVASAELGLELAEATAETMLAAVGVVAVFVPELAIVLAAVGALELAVGRRLNPIPDPVSSVLDVASGRHPGAGTIRSLGEKIPDDERIAGAITMGMMMAASMAVSVSRAGPAGQRVIIQYAQRRGVSPAPISQAVSRLAAAEPYLGLVREAEALVQAGRPLSPQHLRAITNAKIALGGAGELRAPNTNAIRSAAAPPKAVPPTRVSKQENVVAQRQLAVDTTAARGDVILMEIDQSRAAVNAAKAKLAAAEANQTRLAQEADQARTAYETAKKGARQGPRKAATAARDAAADADKAVRKAKEELATATQKHNKNKERLQDVDEAIVKRTDELTTSQGHLERLEAAAPTEAPRLRPGEVYDPKNHRRPNLSDYPNVNVQPVDRHAGVRTNPNARVGVFEQSVPPHLKARHDELVRILNNPKASQPQRAAAGHEYERLMREDIAQGDVPRVRSDVADKTRIPDVGVQEVTVELELSDNKLDQLWRDLLANNTAIVTVPRLSPVSERKLAKLAAIFEHITRRRPNITVRETAP